MEIGVPYKCKFVPIKDSANEQITPSHADELIHFRPFWMVASPGA
jgi:hypothetical protein